MNEWLDIGLKTFVSVLILYVAVNTFWRYHPIAKARHIAALAVVSASIMAFFDPDRAYLLLVFLGAGVFVEAVWFALERRFRRTVHILLLTDKAHRPALTEYFQAGARRHGADPEAIGFCPNSSCILFVKDEAAAAWKPLAKEFERDFRGLLPILALRAYLAIVLALILLAAYWRYW